MYVENKGDSIPWRDGETMKKKQEGNQALVTFTLGGGEINSSLKAKSVTL